MEEVRVNLTGGSRLTRELFTHALTETGMHVSAIEHSGINHPHDVSILVAEHESPSRLLAENPALRTIMITDIDNDDHIVELVLDGADAVITFDASANDLAETVRVVMNGGSVVSPRVTRRLSELARASRVAASRERTLLTSRELDILQSIGRGESVKQTAGTLGISAKTVENLQSRLFRKLDVRNRAQAFAQAHAMGLLPHSVADAALGVDTAVSSANN
jgi:DNA-binding NarL/FixJ family response regulator